MKLSTQKLVVRKREPSLKLSKCSRDEFIKAISDDKNDKFAKTFVAKADMQDQWSDCWGAYNDGGELMAAIITTISKRRPFVANLQLLHTFAKHRGQGAAKILCLESLRLVKSKGAQYFRVSSEPDAVGFYTKIGFKFWGKQKSGCQLSIFRIDGDTYSEGDYDYTDQMINNAIHKKGKGGCVEIFDLATDQKPLTLEGF
jgi:ribosomal protein S18 acetylase RimI-like enzyme